MEITRKQVIESFLQNKEFQFKAKISEDVYEYYNFENAIVAGNTLLCKFVDKADFILNEDGEYESSHYVLNECIVIDESIVPDDLSKDFCLNFQLSIDEMDAFYTVDHIVDPATIPTSKISTKPIVEELPVLMRITYRSQCAAGKRVLDVMEGNVNFYTKEEFDFLLKAMIAISPDNALKDRDAICSAFDFGDSHGSIMNRLKRVLTGAMAKPGLDKLTNVISLEISIVGDLENRVFKIK